MSRQVTVRNLFIGIFLSASLAVSPARADHGTAADIVVPLAAMLAFGALYQNHSHRYSTHRQYYRSYKRPPYGYAYGHNHNHKRRTYSHGGYYNHKY